MHHRMRRAVAGAGVHFTSNGNFLDFEFDSLAGWVSIDAGNGATTQEVFDSRGTFKFDGGATFNSSNSAGRYRDFGSTPVGDRHVITDIFYPASVGASTDAGLGYLVVWWQYHADYRLMIRVYSDKITVDDSTGTKVTVGNINLTAWNKLTIDITGVLSPSTAVCDIYLDDVLIASGVDCANNVSAVLIGTFYSVQLSRDNSPYIRHISYQDRILIGDGFA